MKVRCLVLLLLTAMTLPAQTKPASQHEFATFGGGCFWCMEAVFQHVPGVIHSVSGYSGGRTDNPTYEEICEHGTGHAEVIQLELIRRSSATKRCSKPFSRRMTRRRSTARARTRATSIAP